MYNYYIMINVTAWLTVAEHVQLPQYLTWNWVTKHVSCVVFLKTVAVLGWGQGGTDPQTLPSPPIFDWFQGCIGVYIGVRGYTPYTNLWCFWQRIITSFVTIKQVIRGYTP